MVAIERLRRLIPAFRRIAASTAGNVLPLTAAGVVVIAALVGGGVDISRSYMVKNRLQNACDAGVLAGRRAVTTNGFDDAARAQADVYFDTNFDADDQGVTASSFTPTSPDNGNTIEADATATLPTVVMSIFGFENVNLSVSCSASMSVGNSDVTMVLDVTTSMDQTLSGTSTTRIAALRAAMKNFYSTVATATQGSNARIRYSFVPYSSSVNVGNLIYNLNPNYLVNSWAIQSREPHFVQWGSTTYSDPSPSGSCSGGWSNYGPESTTVSGNTITKTQQQRRSCGSRWSSYYQYRTATTTGTTNTTGAGSFDHWVYKQITYDVSAFKAGTSVSTRTGNNGSFQWSTWDGCIEERSTVADSSFSYSQLTGLSPSGAIDLDIDAAPDVSDDSTKWAPMWRNVAYYRTSGGGGGWGWGGATPADVEESTEGSSASSWCPTAATTLTTMTQSEFNNYADNMGGGGYTYHDIGLIWGGRLASPTGIFSSIVTDPPSNGGNVARHLIFMTDGEMCPDHSAYSSYGIEIHDKRVSGDGGPDGNCNNSFGNADYDDYKGRHAARFRAVCDQIKSKGIRIWVIAFASGLNSDLTYCASTNSAFTAADADQLNQAFQEIAQTVGELRIIQ